MIIASSCQNKEQTKPVDEDFKFKVDSLYEHTLLMGEYSSAEVLDRICLDMRPIKKSETMTTQEKISQMALAFNVTLSGDQENQLKLLEDRMARMMDYWNDAQEEDAKRKCY